MTARMQFLVRLLCVAIAQLALAPSAALAQGWPPSVYADDTMWDWYNHADTLPPMCGASSWFDLRPQESVADAGCIEAAMRQLGASESAVRFFDATTQFLNKFDE